MRDNLQYALNNRTDIGNARLDIYLNKGLLRLANIVRIRGHEIRDTGSLMTVGTNRTAIPSTIVVPLSIRNTTDDYWINFMDWSKLSQIRLVPGNPRQWTTYENDIYWDRNPDGADALEIWGQGPPIWGAGESGTPGIEDGLEEGIHLLAQWAGWLDLGLPEKAAVIDSPARKETGAFWGWLKSNKYPRLLQGVSLRSGGAITVALNDGLDGPGGGF